MKEIRIKVIVAGESHSGKSILSEASDACVSLRQFGVSIGLKTIALEKAQCRMTFITWTVTNDRPKDTTYLGGSKAAVIVSGGDKACPHGCLGLGTCKRVCPFDAAEISEDGISVIDPEKCTGCGICVKECPKAIIQLVPISKGVSILCHSKEKGSEVRKKCAVGCIACETCVRVCPFDAISMEGNLAVLDHERCRVCGLCIPRCPTRTIEGRDWPFPRVEIMEDRCTGCGICTMVCPVDAIEGEKKEIPKVSEERCVGCLLCIDRCPKEAIRLTAPAYSATELAA